MKKCQFLADAATHVHSNSPPAMPCSNRHPPDSANLRFNGITRPIYKRSKSCPLLLSFSAHSLHSFALFALFAATKAPFDHHNIEFSPSRILPSVHPSGWKPDSWFTLKPSPPPAVWCSSIVFCVQLQHFILRRYSFTPELTVEIEPAHPHTRLITQAIKIKFSTSPTFLPAFRSRNHSTRFGRDTIYM